MQKCSLRWSQTKKSDISNLGLATKEGETARPVMSQCKLRFVILFFLNLFLLDRALKGKKDFFLADGRLRIKH